MKISFAPPDLNQEDINEVIQVIKSGWITTGPKTKEFERNIAKHCNTTHAACLSSQTAATPPYWHAAKKSFNATTTPLKPCPSSFSNISPKTAPPTDIYISSDLQANPKILEIFLLGKWPTPAFPATYITSPCPC